MPNFIQRLFVILMLMVPFIMRADDDDQWDNLPPHWNVLSFHPGILQAMAKSRGHFSFRYKILSFADVNHTVKSIVEESDLIVTGTIRFSQSHLVDEGRLIYTE